MNFDRDIKPKIIIQPDECWRWLTSKDPNGYGRCVNPDHLEPVTLQENNRRGNSTSAINARKVECVRGHAFDEANTYVRAAGNRLCRRCHADEEREKRRRKRESK